MKLHLTILSFMLLASAGMKAQNSPFSAVKKGEIINRAAMPADNQDVKIRRAARKAPQVNWSYPSAMPATPFAGGNGTQAAPYQIATAQHLANLAWLVNNMSSYRSLYYELTADIELNKDVLNEERALNVAGAPWTPIGSRYAAFSGHFNGNGHSVKGLYIYSTQEYTGLFGYASNAVIENVGTVDGYIYGCCRTGAIAGCVTNTTIQNCFNSNTMYSKSSLLAGILGHSEGSTKVVACYNSGIVYGYGQYCGSHGRNGNCVGGIVGAVDNGGSVSYCYNTGSVYCGAYGAGGICTPHNSSGPNVSHCHNVGSVSCYNTRDAGGVLATFGSYGYPISPSCSQNANLSGASNANSYATEQSAEQFADGTVLNLIDADGAHFKQGNSWPVLDFVEEKTAEVLVAEGQCGENVWWKLTDGGELIIYGTGAMYDFGAQALAYINQVGPQTLLAGILKLGVDKAINLIKQTIDSDPSGFGLAPWIGNHATIKKVTVEEGVTTIAQGAFLMLTGVTEITIPSTIESVGTGAFGLCIGLTNLYAYPVNPPALTGSLPEYTFCYTAYNPLEPQNYNNPARCVLHVPTTSKALYAEADGWKLFANVTNELEVKSDPVLALNDTENELVAETYKAGNISYTLAEEYIAEGKYASFCLPFNVDLSAYDCFSSVYVPLNFAFYKENKQRLVMYFKEASGIVEAGTPFVAVLKGTPVVLKNCDETAIEEYMNIVPSEVSVFSYTSVGGIMKPNADIKALWNGSYATLEDSSARQLNDEGKMDPNSDVKAFRAFLSVQGEAQVSEVYAIVGDQNDDDETKPAIKGDVNEDGEVNVADITTVANIILGIDNE